MGLTTKFREIKKSNKLTPIIFPPLSADNVRLPSPQYLDRPPQTHTRATACDVAPFCFPRCLIVCAQFSIVSRARPPSPLHYPTRPLLLFLLLQAVVVSFKETLTDPRNRCGNVHTDAHLRSISCFTVTAAQFECEERCFDNRKVGYSQPAPQYSVTQL